MSIVHHHRPSRHLILTLLILIYSTDYLLFLKWNYHHVKASDVEVIANDITASPISSTKPTTTAATTGGRTVSRPNGCPKSLNCTEGFFDEGKDCYEATRTKCNCIAHCCMAFDCRDWANLVQCRRKCGTTPNRFGLKRTEKLECEKYICERHFYDQAWDSRNANDQQRQCIGHCCYAFDCRRALGYCRHACGVESWVTARPLGR